MDGQMEGRREGRMDRRGIGKECSHPVGLFLHPGLGQPEVTCELTLP